MRKTSAKEIFLPLYVLNNQSHLLGVAFAMDTNQFLNAFYRMVNHRGLPVEMISDTSRNFIGSKRELGELVDAIEKNKNKEIYCQ